jgi:transposase
MRRRCLAPLSEEEEATLEAMSGHYPTARVRLRAQVVLMSQRDFDQTQIAKALGKNWRFVHRALTRYEAQGFLGLVEHHPGASRRLTPEQETQVIRWVEEGPQAFHYTFSEWDTRSLRWRIALVFNVPLSRETIRRVLHRQGLRWKRPKRTFLPPDPADYALTKSELEHLLQQAKAGEIILLWHDEAIATLHSTIQCGWSRKGTQVGIPSTGKRGEDHRCAIFAVVNPITGDTHYRLLDKVDKANMRCFLKHLARFYAHADVPVWMVLDNHAAHKNLDEDFQNAGLHPYYLKPRCSELNGIEHLWKWLRRRNLHNEFFLTLPELKTAIQRFFCYIAGVKEQVIRCVA